MHIEGTESRGRKGRDWLASVLAAALSGLVPAAAQSHIEPGLEKAVQWKWRAVPSDLAAWISPAPEPTPPAEAPATPAPAAESVVYEVKRGDALAIIARKYGLFPVHLKTFNALPSDLIRVGQVLKIPTKDEARAIAPLPQPPRKKTPRKKDGESGLTREILETAALQTFLDRHQFSAGPIDGLDDPDFGRVLHLFQLSRPELADPAKLNEAVRAEVGDGFTRYVLKEGDFRYIVPPRASRVPAVANAKNTTPSPGPTYDDLVHADLLLYRTPWEFVAERFHCNEAFLKKLNGAVKVAPQAGMVLRVPNVEPFEIEKSFGRLIQPPEGSLDARAVIQDLSLLEIFHSGQLVAVMPISMARPGLRGRGTWKILTAIPLPRMGTFQEEREQPQRPKPLFGQPDPEPTPTAPAKLASEQFLAAGPNNPVGLVWIDLTKADDPLPYGLHGTSIPDRMQTHYGIGGIQMANWNILRAARLLPPGTDLEWRQGMEAPAPPPAAAPASPAL